MNKKEKIIVLVGKLERNLKTINDLGLDQGSVDDNLQEVIGEIKLGIYPAMFDEDYPENNND